MQTKLEQYIALYLARKAECESLKADVRMYKVITLFILLSWIANSVVQYMLQK